MKKLFNIIALSLAFAPALNGDVVRESVNTLKKQIETADAQGFKESCSAFLESEITTQERKDALTELEQDAQEIKQQRQDELDNMGEATTNKTTLAKGFMQAVGSSILGIGTAYFAGKEIFETDLPLENSLGLTEIVHLPTIAISMIICYLCGLNYYKEKNLGNVNGHPLIVDEKTPLSKGTALVSSASGAALSYFLLKNSIQNWKKGWNYKKYLEQQIANLDEIIACIQQAIRTLE